MAQDAQEHILTNAPYRTSIEAWWDNILLVYRWHHEKHPILEWDIDAQHMDSCPARDCIETRQPHERPDMHALYQHTVEHHAGFIVVNDTLKRALCSSVFP